MFDSVPSRYAKASLDPALVLRPSGFLYNPRNAESYSLNPTAASLVEALLRGTPPDLLWRELVVRFEVSEPCAHRDALQFLSTLVELKLLALPEDERPESSATPNGRRGQARTDQSRTGR